MLGLTLRDEFKGRRLKGTAIELTNKNNTGATQVSARDFLRITYPSHDVLKTIEAAGPGQGLPVTLKGERGQGKSHLMAALYHALTDEAATRHWLNDWSHILGDAKIGQIPLRPGMHVITESLHRHRYKFLWDLLFDNHPHGAYCRGKWEALGDKKPEVPSDEILLALFGHTPTALILDEFQTWYDGLTNTKQFPWRSWAFNFIQILSEIAKEHPDRLVLVVSVRNGQTDAFQQIQRVSPVIVDFQGPTAKHDRLRLLLHRLFENRIQVDPTAIEALIDVHIQEFFRLKTIAPADQAKVREDFLEAWPYAPHLMDLLEDQVLIATSAQGTRDLIRILADLHKRSGDKQPILTAADFRLDDEDSGIAALLDSVANQHHAKLREKALRNLEAVKDAVSGASQSLPHHEAVISALWLRSLAEVNQAGADQATLQVDVTRGKAVDDNAFQVELGAIVENSFNIHEDGNRFIFREEENPRAKLIASARNDKLFQQGEDSAHLAKEIRYVLEGGGGVDLPYRVIVLPVAWKTDPWSTLDDSDTPAQWGNRIPILVLPESPPKPDATLGLWLRDHLQSNRNVVRFLIPRDGSTNLFLDRDLLVLARCVFLAEQWKTQNTEYGKLQTKYQKELREILKARFDRFAIIANWNFQQPANCRFSVESHKAEGSKIPDAIDKAIRENLFIPEDFEELVLAAAPNNEPVGKLLRELKEPRPNSADCIPWLGETLIKERLIRICSKGKIAINLRGMEYLQARDDETEDAAFTRMRGKLGTGKHLDETHVLLPQNVPATGGGTPAAGTGATPTPNPRGRNPIRRRCGRANRHHGLDEHGRRHRHGDRWPARHQRHLRRRRRLQRVLRPGNLVAEPARQGRSMGHRHRHSGPRPEAQSGELDRRATSGAAQEAARRHDLRPGSGTGGQLMALPLDLLRTLQQASPADAWAAILDHAWTLCSAPIEPAKAASEVHARDRALGEIDHWLATAGWDLWSDYETSVPRTAQTLGDWWASRSPGRAVLILDALSLREAPWILHQAELRGYGIQQARPTGAELPPNTTPFAKALGFAQRSALGNNGAGTAHKLPGARTESVDIAWADCAKLIGAEPDWVFWHQWPDHRLHDHDEPGQGLATLTQTVETQLTGDAFWSLVERLATGRRLVLTADHGYAASGQFPDSGKDEAESLKGRFKSGRAVESAEAPGNWSPPLDLAIDSAHGRHLYVNGRRKWKSQGGYPTLTHGGLSILEVAVPFVELIRKAG